MERVKQKKKTEYANAWTVCMPTTDTTASHILLGDGLYIICIQHTPHTLYLFVFFIHTRMHMNYNNNNNNKPLPVSKVALKWTSFLRIWHQQQQQHQPQQIRVLYVELFNDKSVHELEIHIHVL